MLHVFGDAATFQVEVRQSSYLDRRLTRCVCDDFLLDDTSTSNPSTLLASHVLSCLIQNLDYKTTTDIPSILQASSDNSVNNRRVNP